MFNRAVLLCTIPFALLGCSQDSGNSPSSRELAWINVNDASGKVPSAYFVSVGAHRALCGTMESADSGIVCTKQGAALTFSPSDSMPAVIKAEGCATFAGTLHFGKSGTAEIKLDTLDAFIEDSSQATGLYKNDGYEAFQNLAYVSSSEIGKSYLVKFIITGVGSGKMTVHLQNTAKYPLHYGFAQKVLGDPRTLSAFEQDTYYSESRSAIAGTLVYYASVDSMIALTFFPSDKITPAQVALAHRAIEARLQFLNFGTSKNRLYYMPSGSAAEAAATAYADSFSFADIPVRTHAQIFGNITLQIMNTGTAYGTLRKFTANELDTAIVSAHDIVILETLPAEIPLVGGTITKDAQTPLSHVNLAAKSRNTPNIAFNGAALPDSLLALRDSLVKFKVTSTGYTIEKTTLAEAQKYWDSQAKARTTLTYDLTETGLPEFSALGFSSASKVGVKAANLAELHGILPDNSPDGFAVPFYHYDNFLHYATVTDSLCTRAETDCEKEGRAATLCRQVETACRDADSTGHLADYITRITGRTDFAADARTREAMLDNVQYMFRHIPVDSAFGAALDSKVRAMFDTAAVRLRSSTNSEDLADFNGAGLYESFKATTRPKDLPSLEIRKVWASVWAFKAYEERSLWNIDQFSVKMGVAVHAAYPAEKANGVVISQNIADYSVAGIYANVQLGETSITNPEDSSRPEIISIVPGTGGVQTVRLQYSTLSPASPILSDSETLALYKMVQTVQNHFATLYKKSAGELILDIEFKLIGDDRKLIFKQVRPYVS